MQKFALAVVSCTLLASPAAAQRDIPAPSATVAPAAPARAIALPGPAFTGPIAAAPALADGKVTALNPLVFAALQGVKRRNPGALRVADALDLRTAMHQDGKVDSVEADLLSEMTQSQFRSITVTQAGAAADAPKVVMYPVSGNTKLVLRETLLPSLDLDQAWSNGAAGWRAMVREAGKDQTQQLRVGAFVQARVADAWEQSSTTNGFKPLRDLLTRTYGFNNSGATTAEAALGRKLLLDAANQTDRNAGDRMPDFLYSWLQSAPTTR